MLYTFFSSHIFIFHLDQRSRGNQQATRERHLGREEQRKKAPSVSNFRFQVNPKPVHSTSLVILETLCVLSYLGSWKSLLFQPNITQEPLGTIPVEFALISPVSDSRSYPTEIKCWRLFFKTGGLQAPGALQFIVNHDIFIGYFIWKEQTRSEVRSLDEGVTEKTSGYCPNFWPPSSLFPKDSKVYISNMIILRSFLQTALYHFLGNQLFCDFQRNIH